EQLEKEAQEDVSSAVASMLVAARGAIDSGGEPDADAIAGAARSAWSESVHRVLDWLRSAITRLVVDRLSRFPRDDEGSGDRTVSRDVRQRVAAIAEDYVREAQNQLREVPDQVWETVRTQLAAGFIEEETPQELRARVADALQVDTWSPRAERIARTTTTTAFNSAQSTTLTVAESEMDMPLRRMWIA